MTNAQFARWIASTGAVKRYPGGIGYGFVQQVPASGLAAFGRLLVADPPPSAQPARRLTVLRRGVAPCIASCVSARLLPRSRPLWGLMCVRRTGAGPRSRALLLRSCRRAACPRRETAGRWRSRDLSASPMSFCWSRRSIEAEDAPDGRRPSRSGVRLDGQHRQRPSDPGRRRRGQARPVGADQPPQRRRVTRHRRHLRLGQARCADRDRPGQRRRSVERANRWWRDTLGPVGRCAVLGHLACRAGDQRAAVRVCAGAGAQSSAGAEHGCPQDSRAAAPRAARRAHRPAQPRPDPRSRRARDRARSTSQESARGDVPRPRRLQGRQRHPWPRCGRPTAARRQRPPAEDCCATATPSGASAATSS